jgi:hypothetical protein
MIEISKEVEAIFSYAVALEQSGRMKNTIFCGGEEIFIYNYDKTVLMRFALPSLSLRFENEFSFKAEDYDGNKFFVEGDKIVFVRREAGFERKKICGTSIKELAFQEVKSLYEKYSVDLSLCSRVFLDKDILGLLEEGLSHIEFFVSSGKLNIVQRDIYSGNIIHIVKYDVGGLGLHRRVEKDVLVEDFGPLGIRTDDFIALFNFHRRLCFYFPPSGSGGFCFVSGEGTTMTSIIAWCLYDDLGTINIPQEVVSNGREIEENRNSKQEIDRANSIRRRARC